MGRTDKFRRYKRRKNLYHVLEMDQSGHIMNPCDPKKMLYKRTLKELCDIVEENPDFEQLDYEIDYFREVFEVNK
jgi:hypothetical protein